MIELFSNFPDLIQKNFRFVDVIDILVITFIIYNGLNFIYKTRAAQLLKGIVLIFIVMILSDIFKMYSVNYILTGFLNFGIIAAVVVFQPELRSALEYLGRANFGGIKFKNLKREKMKKQIVDLVEALDFLSIQKTGAIFVIQKITALGEYVKTGTAIDSIISPQILENIFQKNSPLHDGAVIIKDERIVSAGCFLPVSKSRRLTQEIGTRHRAALGITEISDAVAFVVSEETGALSIAENGELDRFVRIKDVQKKLYKLFIPLEEKSNGILGLKEAIIQTYNSRKREDV